MTRLVIQSDKPNLWWLPTGDQMRVLRPLYKRWGDGLGQGGMTTPGTELIERGVAMDGWLYTVHIYSRENAYFINKNTGTKRRFLFLPRHDGINHST